MKSSLNTGMEIPRCVTFQDGQGLLPCVEVRTPASEAEIYLHGAHVTHFQKTGEPPLLFMSKMSRYSSDAPIRGGVPVILPWFGPRPEAPTHGMARTQSWTLKEITLSGDDTKKLHFQLPACQVPGFEPFTADYFVTVGTTLELELITTNNSKDRNLVFEDCLHTYFHVGDIAAVRVRGLQGARYLDRLQNQAEKQETAPEITVAGEVDRSYLDTTAAVEIHDASFKRIITVEKEGSRSTVVWNPWIAKSQAMPDFGNEEYLQMICVESGNVIENRITLAPGQSHILRVRLGSRPM